MSKIKKIPYKTEQNKRVLEIFHERKTGEEGLNLKYIIELSVVARVLLFVM